MTQRDQFISTINKVPKKESKWKNRRLHLGQNILGRAGISEKRLPDARVWCVGLFSIAKIRFNGRKIWKKL